MCLEMWIEGDASAAEQLASAADLAAKESGLHFTRRHPLVRWPWAREKPVVIYVSAGGCACSLLSDDADCGDEYWALEPKAADQLGIGLVAFAQHGPDKRRIFDRETGDATGPRDRDEVDGL